MRRSPPSPHLHYSINDHRPHVLGFTNARSWLADVREHADPHLTCILVGNKVDLVSESPDGPGSSKHREVTTEEAQIWAQEQGLLFVEASAKSGLNVEHAFEQACRDILDKIRRGVFEDDRVRVSLSLFRLALTLMLVSGCQAVKACQQYPSTRTNTIKRILLFIRPRLIHSLLAFVHYLYLSLKIITWNLYHMIMIRIEYVKKNDISYMLKCVCSAGGISIRTITHRYNILGIRSVNQN